MPESNAFFNPYRHDFVRGLGGGTLLLNLSASNATVSKAEFRRELIGNQACSTSAVAFPMPQRWAQAARSRLAATIAHQATPVHARGWTIWPACPIARGKGHGSASYSTPIPQRSDGCREDAVGLRTPRQPAHALC